MHGLCLLTTMERILKPNCSLLCLHSNDMNSLKCVFLKKKVLSINIIVTKNTQIKTENN